MISRPSKASACIAAVVVVFGTIGCQTVATDHDQPARIADTSDASHRELQTTVNAALNTEVTLANDALTTSSLLIIERNSPRSIDHAPDRGRVMDAPIQFRLVMNGADCVLIDDRDESRYLLEKASCISE